MSSIPSVSLSASFDLTTSWQTLYSVPSNINRTTIDAATFNNYSSANVDVSVRIVPSGATASTLNELSTDTTIRAGRNFLMPGLIGQVISYGGSLQAKASANSSVSAHIAGTEIEP